MRGLVVAYFLMYEITAHGGFVGMMPARAHTDGQERVVEMKALALTIIVIASVLIVFGRFRRNNPVAIVGFAVLAVGLILGLLSR
jgi:hypothetical protein